MKNLKNAKKGDVFMLNAFEASQLIVLGGECKYLDIPGSGTVNEGIDRKEFASWCYEHQHESFILEVVSDNPCNKESGSEFKIMTCPFKEKKVYVNVSFSAHVQQIILEEKEITEISRGQSISWLSRVMYFNTHNGSYWASPIREEMHDINKSHELVDSDVIMAIKE